MKNIKQRAVNIAIRRNESRKNHMKNKGKYILIFALIFMLFATIAPTSLFANPRADVSAFVTRFYQLCLSRNPEPQGLTSWTDFLISGQKTGADVAYGFVFSPEFVSRNVSNHDFVTIMYRAFFDRQPDPTGFSGWVGELDRGRSRQYVLAGFVNSQEFKNLSARFGINPGTLSQAGLSEASQGAIQPPADQRVAEFVGRFYQICLGREPDSAGLNGWVSELSSGRRSGVDMAVNFINSPEFLSRRLSNADYVTTLYSVLFNRAPDGAGFNALVSQLNSGRSRNYILFNFLYSQEFSGLCAQYGIKHVIAGVPTSKIVGSPHFVNSVSTALTLLQLFDPAVYAQFARVSSIREADLRAYRASGMANASADVYIDYAYGHKDYGDTAKVVELALTLSHEFNHVANLAHWNRLATVELERMAVTQELETARKIAGPGYIAFLEWQLRNIYNPATWWWRPVMGFTEDMDIALIRIYD